MTKRHLYDIMEAMDELKNESELLAFGQKLGTLLESGDLLVLTGDLGTGKTTLTKGLAKGLEIDQMIKSPTYTIVREYEGRLPLYHLDVYRIGDDPDSIDLDAFLFSGGVTVIEWGELVESHLPLSYLKLTLSVKGDGRQIRLEAHGQRAERLVRELAHI